LRSYLEHLLAIVNSGAAGHGKANSGARRIGGALRIECLFVVAAAHPSLLTASSKLGEQIFIAI
jgi:hypothetical protein